MPDISMCNAQCPISVRCKRHGNSGTKPSWRQAYAGFEPDGANGCGAYYPKESAKEPQP